jgi:deoxyribodipyrimidine photolyase
LPSCHFSLCSSCTKLDLPSSADDSLDMPAEMPRILLYIIRRDVRLSDNPIFASAARHITRNDDSDSAKRSRDDSLTSEHRGASFTHLLPVYIFPANQIEVSGFLSSPSAQSPYPEARSQVARLWRTGPHRAKFIAEGVWDLKKSLEGLECGSGLDLKVGKIGDVVKNILEFYSNKNGGHGATGDVTGIWMTADESPEEKDEERAVKKIADQNSVEFKLWNDEKYYIDEYVIPAVATFVVTNTRQPRFALWQHCRPAKCLHVVSQDVRTAPRATPQAFTNTHATPTAAPRYASTTIALRHTYQFERLDKGALVTAREGFELWIDQPSRMAWRSRISTPIRRRGDNCFGSNSSSGF